VTSAITGGIVTDLNVKPAELLASARMTDAINNEALGASITRAIAGMADISQSLAGWSIQSELDDLRSTWHSALKGLQDRMSASANALRGCAATHEWNDTLLGRDFEGL
jgi:hypothetical protein